MKDPKTLQLFHLIPDQEKLDFLKKALGNSVILESQFIKYFENQPKALEVSQEAFEKMIEESSGDYIEALQAINLEETDWENYHALHNDYVPEWEAAQMMAEEEVTDVFKSIGYDLQALILDCELHGFFAEVTALLIACEEAEVDDPNDNLGDPNQFFMDTFKQTIPELFDTIRSSIFQPEIIPGAIALTMRSFAAGMAKGYNPSTHDALFLPFLEKHPEKSDELFKLIVLDEKIKSNFPKASIFIMQHSTAGKLIWTDQAEKLCTTDASVAHQLLEHHHSRDTKSFYRVAKKAFPVFPRQLRDYILDSIDDNYDIEFTKNLLNDKIEQNQNIKDYRRIKKLMDESEITTYLESFKDGWSMKFYVQMLENDGLYQKILELARGWNSGIYNLVDVLGPLAKNQPEACCQIALRIGLNELEKNQGRHLYQQIAELLATIAKYSVDRAQAIDVAREILKHYTRRPALKDELRKADLL